MSYTIDITDNHIRALRSIAGYALDAIQGNEIDMDDPVLDRLILARNFRLWAESIVPTGTNVQMNTRNTLIDFAEQLEEEASDEEEESDDDL